MTNMIVTMKKVVLPHFDPTSNSFALAYKYDSANVATLNSGIVVTPYCTSPCQRCRGTKTSC